MKPFLFLLILVCLLTGCASLRSYDKPIFYPRTGPRHFTIDEFLGISESEILTKFGKPIEEMRANALEFTEDVEHALRNRASFTEEVKRLDFEDGEIDRVFWFVKDDLGTWRVVADRAVPPGVVF